MPVLLCPCGARRIWKLYACPYALLTAPPQDATVSFYLLYCFADIEPHSGHVFWLSDKLHREHLYILPLPFSVCARVP